ncbi:hypothetical protein EVAR_4546_1 [Eumeta japonica]|uniref:BESS domain-containing protein n=1 Tax=Eumeta variegata TaxID=151549 RepID=A0A4C1SWT3_EUMVA|nr:hypothetical protein EVAR_4546_1 [Eumeta japonica]
MNGKGRDMSQSVTSLAPTSGRQCKSTIDHACDAQNSAAIKLVTKRRNGVTRQAGEEKEGSGSGKEIQKRWRSIRDSYTKAFRQGKCVLPEHCPSTSRRYQYHRQMSFLLRALQNKKPRASQDKYESFSEVSNSPQHPPPDDFVPRIKSEPVADQKPLDLKTRPDTPDKTETKTAPTVDKANQVTIEDIELNHGVDMRNPSLEIKIDANSILPDDHFNDDKLFMNSLLPLFKKMDDDTRLLCRIEVLKIIRYALQGHKCFEALKIAEDSFFKTRISGILAKEENESSVNTTNGSTLSMTTRSADGSRPIRKRRLRSPSPLPPPPKRRGPGRPRKNKNGPVRSVECHTLTESGHKVEASAVRFVHSNSRHNASRMRKRSRVSSAPPSPSVDIPFSIDAVCASNKLGPFSSPRPISRHVFKQDRMMRIRTRLVGYHTLTEYGREIAASALAFGTANENSGGPLPPPPHLLPSTSLYSRSISPLVPPSDVLYLPKKLATYRLPL